MGEPLDRAKTLEALEESQRALVLTRGKNQSKLELLLAKAIVFIRQDGERIKELEMLLKVSRDEANELWHKQNPEQMGR